MEKRYGHFFTQHDAARDEAYNFLVRDVTRSTSAAPTYFECVHVTALGGKDTYTLVDGGVFVNNPAMCAFTEVMEVSKENNNKIHAENMICLSVGTGDSEKEYAYDNVKQWGIAEWIQPLISIMMGGASDATHYQLEQLFYTAGKPNQYLRVNSKIPDYVDNDIDNATEENLLALKKFGHEVAEAYDKQLNHLVDLIMKEEE